MTSEFAICKLFSVGMHDDKTILFVNSSSRSFYKIMKGKCSLQLKKPFYLLHIFKIGSETNSLKEIILSPLEQLHKATDLQFSLP